MADDIRVGLVPTKSIVFHPHNVRSDLGDLRPLANSISRYGIMQPVVLERYGDTLRLRAGARRVAAALLIELPRVPAIIHSTWLPEREWLEHAVQENVQRAELDRADRKRTITELRHLGCTVAGIADTFGVAPATIHAWLNDTTPPAPKVAGVATPVRRVRVRRGPSPRKRATDRLIEQHEDEFNQYLAEESESSAPV